MKITFHGAAGGVTGSCHLLETVGKKILLDCGMFQGGEFNEKMNHEDFGFNPESLDALIVTHAHLDHVGRIPKLIRDGYTGPIYMTYGTKELALLVLEDAVHIMEENEEKYGTPVLYTLEDVQRVEKQCKCIEYHNTVPVADGVIATWKDAGHILGSAFIEIESADGRVGFSGDVGNNNVPILRDTDQLGNVDVLLIESTYGDRVHEGEDEKKKIILEYIDEGVKHGGTIMIPSFSIERTQEILYHLHELSEDGTLPEIPMFLDSPLAIKAISVYEKHQEYLDREALEQVQAGENFLQFPNLKFTETVNESKDINHIIGPKLIIAGSGMMNGGRIVHHAMRYLPDPNSLLIFVGYQAEGTLGRKIYNGAEKVHIFDEDIPVKCTVKAIGALSAHGDQEKLVSWVRNAEKLPKKIYCVHGEPNAATTLAHRFKDEMNIPAFVPEKGESFEI
ncbi:MAG: MBL fold metallo-hydrolase [Candidatus Magasanikbacteria bacterium]